MTRRSLATLAMVALACSAPAGGSGTDPTIPATSRLLPTTTLPTTTLPTTTGPTATVPSSSAAGPHRIELIPDLPFTSQLRLDVYRPVDPGPWPVVVMAHGGGWVGGDRTHLAALARTAATSGLVVYNADYRTIQLGGANPATFEDIACAVRYARATAQQYGGRPDRLALLGYSAGGHLAAVVALAGDAFSGDCAVDQGSALPEVFVGVSGPYDSDEFQLPLALFFGGTIDEVPEAWAAGNPYSYVGENPQLIVRLFWGQEDPLVPARFASDFESALTEAGYDVELTLVPGADHTGMRDPAGGGRAVVTGMLEAVG